MIVSEQLNYTKTRWFHAIFLPVIIEFSRCIGTYSSAKFEYLMYNGRIKEYTSACFSTDSLHQICSQPDIKLITKEDFFQYVEHAYRFTNLVSILIIFNIA